MVDRNYEYQLLREIRDLEDTIREKNKQIAELRAWVTALGGDADAKPLSDGLSEP